MVRFESHSYSQITNRYVWFITLDNNTKKRRQCSNCLRRWTCKLYWLKIHKVATTLARTETSWNNQEMHIWFYSEPERNTWHSLPWSGHKSPFYSQSYKSRNFARASQGVSEKEAYYRSGFPQNFKIATFESEHTLCITFLNIKS